MNRVALITGSYGYLGAGIRNRLESDGWGTRALVRKPRPRDAAWAWSLGQYPPLEALEGVETLVHCAYDFRPTRFEDIRRINVRGTELLLRTAADAGVARCLVLSSMSAYSGTTQFYGLAKLEIEEIVLDIGGIAIRPGLVYGDRPSGLAGALLALTRLPVTPVLGNRARQFPVHEDDLANVVSMILSARSWIPEVIGVAQPRSVTLRELLSALAATEGRRPRFAPVPWRLVYWALRAWELAGIPMPLRSDSVLGLVHPASHVPSSRQFPGIIASLRVMKLSK